MFSPRRNPCSTWERNFRFASGAAMDLPGRRFRLPFRDIRRLDRVGLLPPSTIGPVNDPEARESGLWLKMWVVHGRTDPSLRAAG
jgi:hypothetical protein